MLSDNIVSLAYVYKIKAVNSMLMVFMPFIPIENGISQLPNGISQITHKYTHKKKTDNNEDTL